MHWQNILKAMTKQVFLPLAGHMAVQSYLKIVGNLHIFFCRLFLALSSSWGDPQGCPSVLLSLQHWAFLLWMLVLEIPNILGHRHHFDR